MQERLSTRLLSGGVTRARRDFRPTARFPNESAQACYVVFAEVEIRLGAYLKLKFGLSSRASAEAAQRLLGQVLHPRFPRALFGADPLLESFDEKGLSPSFNLRPIRKAVKILLASLNQPSE